MKETGKINYLEMPSRDLDVKKQFFSAAFGGSFVEGGPEYVTIDKPSLLSVVII